MHPPKFLDSTAAEFWERNAKLLPDGTLDRAGAWEGFVLLCMTWSDLVFLMIETHRNPTVIRRAPTGAREEANPKLKAKGDAYGKYIELAKQYGLTPLSHEKLRKAAAEFDAPDKVPAWEAD